MKNTAIAFLALMATPAFAQMQESSDKGYLALATALAIGIAVLGGTLSQGKIGSAAMDGLARNPQASNNMFVPMILGLVFIESLVIFSFVISFQLLGKI
jgi:F-type H+-transporting ATPase subunit c